MELSQDQLLAKFSEVTALGIAEQAKYFLKEFVTDFAGNFEEVLELSEEFKTYAPEGGVDDVRELEEDKAHLFLERRGETMTVKELRDALREIDVDKNNKVCFIEYCMFKYGKTLKQLFAPKPQGNAKLLQQLEEAIALHEEVMAKRKADEDKMQELTKQSQGTGVKAMKAKAELEQMRVRSQTGQNIAEVRAAFKKKRAQKELGAYVPDPEELRRQQEEEEKKAKLLEEEMERLKVEEQKKKEQEAFKRQESQRRLKERAAAFS
eukprot:m.335497 g.335497  ORF g.335497 m.335497 type:complete len:265 (-) comp17611_c0_seq1:73-867(-)